MSQEILNLIDNQKKLTEKLLQAWLDMNSAYDEWNKEHQAAEPERKKGEVD